MQCRLSPHLQKNLHRDRKPRLREKGVGRGTYILEDWGVISKPPKRWTKYDKILVMHMVLILLASGKWHTTLSIKRLKCSKWSAKLKACDSDRLLGIFVWTNANKGNITSCVESHDAKSMSEFLAETSSFQGNKTIKPINKYPLTHSKRVVQRLDDFEAWEVPCRGVSMAATLTAMACGSGLNCSREQNWCQRRTYPQSYCIVRCTQEPQHQICMSKVVYILHLKNNWRCSSCSSV